MNIQLIDISQVKPNPNNPRIIKDYRFDKLVKSIQDFPEMLKLRPIVVDNNFMVLGGNMRLKSCEKAGHKKVYVIKADDLTEEQKKEFIIKDNLGYGEWDWDLLANEWEADLLDEWGLDVPTFDDEEVLEAEEDNFAVNENTKTDIVLGDLIEIGNHRLLCGDSTDSDQVAKLMNGKKAELLFTSPPYSDMRDYNGNKDLSVTNISEFITTWFLFAEYQAVNLGIQRKDNNIVPYWDDYIEKAQNCGYNFLCWNVWNRIHPKTLAHQSAFIPIAHEFIFVFGKRFKEINKTIECENAGKNNTSINRSKDGSQFKRNYDISDTKKINSITTTGVASTGEHPAMFPIAFPSEYINAITSKNDLVADCFLGSGTTMVASHQLNRVCYGMELDPVYCQVIIDRMLKLDPDLQIKINGKDYLVA